MSKKVTARFTCQSIKQHATNDPSAVHLEVEFTALYGDGTGNETWSKWTPSGKLAMTITNPACVGAFVPGKTYALDITQID